MRKREVDLRNTNRIGIRVRTQIGQLQDRIHGRSGWADCNIRRRNPNGPHGCETGENQRENESPFPNPRRHDSKEEKTPTEEEREREGRNPNLGLGFGEKRKKEKERRGDGGGGKKERFYAT